MALRHVYFIRAKVSGLIKIGSATRPYTRLAELQTGSPDKLSLMGTITSADAATLERDLHARFAEHRQHGEWFRPHPDVLSCIMADARYMPDPSPRRPPRNKLSVEDRAEVGLCVAEVVAAARRKDPEAVALHRHRAEEITGCEYGLHTIGVAMGYSDPWDLTRRSREA